MKIKYFAVSQVALWLTALPFCTYSHSLHSLPTERIQTRIFSNFIVAKFTHQQIQYLYTWLKALNLH